MRQDECWSLSSKIRSFFIVAILISIAALLWNYRVWLINKHNQALIGNAILLFTAIAVAVYAWHNRRIWQIMLEQHCPYIVIPRTTTDTDEQNVPVHIVIHFLNAGQCPAMDFSSSIKTDWYANERGAIDILPNAPLDICIPPVPDVLRREVAIGQAILRMRLILRYRDTSGRIYRQTRLMEWSMEHHAWRLLAPARPV